MQLALDEGRETVAVSAPVARCFEEGLEALADDLVEEGLSQAPVAAIQRGARRRHQRDAPGLPAVAWGGHTGPPRKGWASPLAPDPRLACRVRHESGGHVRRNSDHLGLGSTRPLLARAQAPSMLSSRPMRSRGQRISRTCTKSDMSAPTLYPLPVRARRYVAVIRPAAGAVYRVRFTPRQVVRQDARQDGRQEELCKCAIVL